MNKQMCFMLDEMIQVFYICIEVINKWVRKKKNWNQDKYIKNV